MTRSWAPALLVALAWLAVSIPLLDRYGATWDCAAGDYAYGDRILEFLESFDERLLDLEAEHPSRHPTPPPRFRWSQLYPFATAFSGASCRAFHSELGWLPALEAHHLVVPLFVGALLFGIVVVFGRRLGILVGVTSALVLAAHPRWFAHGFNNLKDVPEACLYVAAAWAGFTAMQRGGYRWFLAGGLSAMALAQKANAVFIPVQLALLLAITRLVVGGGPTLRVSWRGVGAASVTFLAVYLAVSPPFWFDTWTRVRIHFEEILRAGTVSVDGAATDPWHGTLHAAWTTPLVVLGAATVGLFARGPDRHTRIFLVVSVLLPVARTMLPGVRDFDGIRHFLEFLPPLCVLAAVGAVAVGRLVARPFADRGWVSVAVPVLVLSCSAWQAASLHPNGVCYYNSIVGGLEGARARGIDDATDYWANSYRQGIRWLSETAPRGAALTVPIALQVAEWEEGATLRDDLVLLRPGEGVQRPPLYVMYVTRRSWYDAFLLAFDHAVEPALEIRVQGAPILRILRIDDPALIGAGAHLLSLPARRPVAARGLRAWLGRPGSDRDAFVDALRAFDPAAPLEGLQPVLGRLRPLLPPELMRALVR